MDDFVRLLDAYGGDPARWPAERRMAAERLVAADPAARRLLEEAVALDRALSADAGRRPDADRLARLGARIMLATDPLLPAARQERTNVVDLRGHDARLPASRRAAVHPPTPRLDDVEVARGRRGREPVRATGAVVAPADAARLPQPSWRTPALLAASLVLGVLIGGFALPQGSVSAFDLADRDGATEVVTAVLGDGFVRDLKEEHP
jgi:hypothetical protein